MSKQWSANQENVNGVKRLLATAKRTRRIVDTDGKTWIIGLRENESRFTNAWLHHIRSTRYPTCSTVIEMLSLTGAVSTKQLLTTR